jgi:hypothetical protein
LSQRQRTEDDLSRTANEMDDTSEKASAVDDPFSLDDDDDENLAKGRSAYRLFIRLPTARKRPELKPVDVSNSAVGTAGERIPVMGRSRGARSIPFSGIDLPGSIPLPSAQSGHTSGDSGSSGESRSDQWMRVSPK